MKITAKKRDILGKKVRTYRRENQIPANFYGFEQPSINVLVDQKEFQKTYKSAGHNKLVDLTIDGENTSAKVLIKEVQNHSVSEAPIHVSFYKVDMNREIIAEIPVLVEGLSPAVKSNIGLLVVPQDYISVKCLPANLPANITIDVSHLENIGDAIKLSTVDLGEGVKATSRTNPNLTLAYIISPQKQVMQLEEETTAAEASPAEGEAAEEGTEAKAE